MPNNNPLITLVYCLNTPSREMAKRLMEWEIPFNVLEVSDELEYYLTNILKDYVLVYIDDFPVCTAGEINQFTEEVFYDRLDAYIETKTSDEIKELCDEPF